MLAHQWYFSTKSLDFLLSELECKYHISLDQRYDLSNHLAWAQNRRPGGAGSFTDILGNQIENQYKEALIKAGHADTVVAVISRDN